MTCNRAYHVPRWYLIIRYLRRLNIQPAQHDYIGAYTPGFITAALAYHCCVMTALPVSFLSSVTSTVLIPVLVVLTYTAVVPPP